jgi:capsular polysaccharide biosynthesis protein
MERKDNREVLQINLKRVFHILWKRLWAILLVGILVGAVCFSYAWFFITPTYAAKAQMYVNNNYVGSPGFSSSQIAAALSLADTYMVIMQSHNVLDEVIERTGLNYTYGQVRGMVSAATVNETEVFEIRVTCANYKHAAIIANTIAEILPDKIAAVVEGSSVRLVDHAIENPNPVGPSYQRYLMLGFFLGGVICALIIVVLDVVDTSITSEEYLQQAYANIPLLAVIPFSEEDRNGHHKGYYESVSKRGKNQRGGRA